MVVTNKLLSVQSSEVSGADLIKLWSQKYGSNVALSLTNLSAALAVISPASDGSLTTQYSSPNATGFNVAVTVANTWLILTPDAAYAAGTITLPASSGVANKSEVLLNTTQQITTLTVAGNGASGVIGAPSSLGASDFLRLRYDAQSYTWYRVG